MTQPSVEMTHKAMALIQALNKNVSWKINEIELIASTFDKVREEALAARVRKETLGPHNETYLGDGLYASFDGFQIWLHAPRDYSDHFIALEPDVVRALNTYITKLRESAKCTGTE